MAENARGAKIPAWVCARCGESLAFRFADRGNRDNAMLARGLIRLPKDREGMHSYGLPPAELVGRQRRAGRTGSRPRRMRGNSGPKFTAPAMPWGPEEALLPFFVYCPRRGVCGLGQVVNGPLEEMLSKVVIG
jgi:hypothetical protein